MSNIQHSKKKCEHYTPLSIILATRSVFDDDIDLDPASDVHGNSRIKAKRFLTDSLNTPWTASNVFCNPPGSTEGYRGSLSTDFYDKFLTEYLMGNFEEGIFLAYSVELLCKRGYTIINVENTALCIPQPDRVCTSGLGRIMFYEHDKETGGFVEQRSPTHGNAIIYKGKNVYRFKRFFKKFGVLC